MKKNISQIKDNNQSNFSSVPTFAYSSSLASSPLKVINSIDKDKLVSESKYCNENIFGKKVNKGINQSVNTKQRNIYKGIYITSLGNASETNNELPKTILTTTNENTNISKSISNLEMQAKKEKSNHRLSLNLLPYINTNNSIQNEDLIPISPLFSCCDHENSPKLLNKILFRQKIQEEKEKEKKSNKVSGKNKNEESLKPKKVTVKDGPKNYIDKTRELNRLRYFMNLKLESIKDFYYDYRQEIKNIDFTMNSIRAYKHNLENKFINEYVSQLRTLNKITLNERLKEEEQRNQIVRLKKDISNMVYKKKRLEINKYLIEKWVGLQIYIKDKIRIEDKKIRNYINKHYKGQTIFQSADEFEDFFKKKEINNLRLIKTLNIKTEEKAVLFKSLKSIEQYNIEDDNYLLNMISDKEKALKILKNRNEELLFEKNEVSKYENQYSSEDINPKSLSTSVLTPKKEKSNEKNKIDSFINYNIIFSLIQKTFTFLISEDREALTETDESLNYIKSIINPSTKALLQMKIIEMAYIFLIYYKMDNIKGNETLYKQLMEEIEQSQKKQKAEKYRKEEELKEIELHKKMEEKKNRVIFKPTRQDLYSSLIYIEKLKNKERKMKKKVKKKIDIFDFLYDVDEDKDNI